ncbi:MAG: autotransporter-associated beta strand repeat-containing protein, partial [Planctomycetota bacterium]|nr:autotransporter-associated beta strand repeat-containing protein [Planctomycetota bacterium]
VSAGATFDVSGLTGGTLTLNAGQTLAGNGTVLGTLDTGTGTLAPGASAGTLSVANLTLGSGSSLHYELANVTTIGSGVNDYTIVSGTLTVAGPVTLNLTYLNSLPAGSGKYTLFSYNTFSGNVTDISVPSGFTINNNPSAQTIELLINHNPANLTWRGDGSSDFWDIDTTPNWVQYGTPITFFNGDTANFDDTGSNSPPIFVAAPVIAAAVNVNASRTYDFTGSSVSAASFTKGGSGTWILENDNTYSSGGIISDGTLQIGNAGSTGTLAG